jgi:peptide/nickel transport system permease protein
MAMVACAVFLLAAWVPGDAASGLVERGAPSATVAAVRTQLGLDRPISERLIERIEGLARGDLGQTVSDVLARPLQCSTRPAVQYPGLGGDAFSRLHQYTNTVW